RLVSLKWSVNGDGVGIQNALIIGIVNYGSRGKNV
ncbi:MAG: hypothetical protein UX47_C0006G0001, partial [Candidatus Collierbacteria bacterium GW2011_GWA2_46_26]